MGNLGAVVRMVAQRSLGHWRLLAALAAGVVLASALMASVSLYSDAIRDLGLVHAFDSKGPAALDIRVSVSGSKAVPSEYEFRREAVANALDRWAGDVVEGTVRFGRSATFFPAAPGELPPEAEDRPRAQLQFQERLDEHSRIVEGRAPVPLPQQDGRLLTVEVAMGAEAAKGLGIAVGDEFDLHPFWRKEPAPIAVRVVGLVGQTDPGDRFWAGSTDRFALDTGRWKTYLFFLDEGVLVDEVGAFLPDMDISVDTLAVVDTGRIDSSNAERVEGRVRSLDGDLRAQVPFADVETALPDTIADYQSKLFFTRLPLFALMVQVVGIVLFYLVMVASMVVERQTGEIALFKSRGAGTWQVMTIFALEAGAICLGALALGPLVAVAAISLLGLTPPFEELSGGSLLDVRLSAGAVGLSAFGAVLAFAALLWPAYRACRLSITHYKQQVSRPPTQSAFLKYYLDLALIAVGAFAFYQLREKGSLATERLFGGLSADLVLLATPSLFILMSALIFLRLFPLALRAAAWAAALLPGPTVALGLTRMVRSPLQHSRLILLLILTTAVGVFAAGFRATLEQGYADRAAYRAGAEVRVADVRKPPAASLPAFREAVGAAAGTDAFVAVARVDARVNLEAFRSAELTVLGVEPDEFAASVAGWRDDFGGGSLEGLLNKVEVPPAPAPDSPVIPDGARYVGAWVLNPLPANGGQLGLRLRDEDGATREYRLTTEGETRQSPAAGGWRFYLADLTRPTTNRNAGTVSGPLHFDSVYLRLTGTQPAVAQQVVAYFDDLQWSASAPTAGWGTAGLSGGTVVEPFDDLGRYEIITGISDAGNPGQIARTGAPDGRTGSVAALSFARSRSAVPVVGLRAASGGGAVPAVVDHGFLEATGKKVGDEFLAYANGQYVPLRIADTFDLFPTFDPEGPEHLAIADYAALQAAATRAPSGTEGVYPTEAWLREGGGGGVTRESLAAKGVEAGTVEDRQLVEAQQAADPLVAASWQGILFLSFAAVLLLSALGFVTYAALSAQSRSLEFAILRTMGFSSRQIIGVVSFEQAFVIAAGVAAGTLLGFPLGRFMIDYMGITEEGTTPLPPLVSQVSWQAVATVYTLLGIVVVTTVTALVLLYSRLAVSRALRMGEL